MGLQRLSTVYCIGLFTKGDMKYLAMICLVLLLLTYLISHMFFFMFALRHILILFLALGLVFIVLLSGEKGR
jgi:hypothetical protein